MSAAHVTASESVQERAGPFELLFKSDVFSDVVYISMYLMLWISLSTKPPDRPGTFFHFAD